MELMDTRLIDIIKAGDMFVLSAPSGDFYSAERVSKKSTVWNYHVQADTAAVNAKTVVEVLKSDCGGFIGFRSHHAEGKILQACKDKATVLRFNNYNFDKWEHWTIYGSSLNKTLLVNRKFPDKHFEASFEKVLITTEGALNAFLKNRSDEHTEKLKEKCQDEVPVERKIQVQNNRVLVEGDYCDMQNSAQLHNIIDQAVSTMIQRARCLWTETQALESENMLKAAYQKAQDLEAQVVQLQQYAALSRKEADEKLVFLLHELDNARLVAEGVVADQSKFKLVEGEYKQVKNELDSSKSLLHSMEMKEKMARDEVEKLSLQCNRMGREANELRTLLNDGKANLKMKEEEMLLKVEALEDKMKTMTKREEHQKELLRTVEKELKNTVKRAADLESELKAASSNRKVDFRGANLEEELSNLSSERFTEQQKSQSNVFFEGSSSDANEGGPGSKHPHENLGLKEIKLKNAKWGDSKGSVHVKAQISSVESMMEQQEIQIKELQKKEARSRIEITELEQKLRKSESEVSSHKELLSCVHKEVLEVKLNRDRLMQKLKKVERKAEADMLRIKMFLEETMFSQKCKEMVTAVLVLSNKVLKLESLFQVIQSKIKSNLEVSTLTISALNVELSCSKELISSLQDLLKQAEVDNDAAGTEIKSITKRFSDLNEQLKQETKRLEMQIAPLMQENEDMNATILLLQHKFQESSHIAKLQEKKLKEGLSRRMELQKKVHNLRVNLKEMRERDGTSNEDWEKIQETTHHALMQDMAHRGTSTFCTHSCFATFFAFSFIGFWWILWERF